MNTHLLYSARHALVTAVLISMLGVSAFFAFEPSIGHTQEQFTVSQTVTDEVSFLVAPSDVTMVGSIQGLTGGYATGTTVAVVTTNDPQGYYMTLSFSSSTAMNLGDGSTGYINNYTPATPGTPDFAWVDNTSGGSAEFGYTVHASSSSELDPTFLDNGSACEQVAGSQTADRCWMNPSTTPERIIVTAAPAAYSTTTIKFKVAVPSNPSPVLPSGIYVATGTLTIAGNP